MKVKWEIILIFLGCLAFAALCVGFNYLYNAEAARDFQEKSDKHWADVAWCQDQGGTVVYDGRWYDKCIVAP